MVTAIVVNSVETIQETFIWLWVSGDNDVAGKIIPLYAKTIKEWVEKNK